jgi:hypothetical protein
MFIFVALDKGQLKFNSTRDTGIGFRLSETAAPNNLSPQNTMAIIHLLPRVRHRRLALCRPQHAFGCFLCLPFYRAIISVTALTD